MKRKNFEKKLVVKKSTVTNMEMAETKGGINLSNDPYLCDTRFVVICTMFTVADPRCQ